MYKIKHHFRLTIIFNDKKVVSKIFPNYNKAFSFCANHFIKNFGNFYWSRDLKKLIKIIEIKNSDDYNESVFIEKGFTRRVFKNLQIFIDEIFEGTDKKYPIGKNMHSKHHFEVKSPEKLWVFNSMSYKLGYNKVGKYLYQKLPNAHWSCGLNYMQDGYDIAPLLIKGKMTHKIKNTTIKINPI